MIDGIAIGVVVFIVGGLATAIFLYLRRAYREGGWKQVRRDAVIAVVAFILGVIINRIHQSEAEHLGKTISDAWSRFLYP
jgi:hypothetical protein